MGSAVSSADWDGYVAGFHADHAGITEDILCGCTDGGGTPYDWLLADLPMKGIVVDIGCGSAPLHSKATGWVGVDVSIGELAAASARGRRPLLAGRAERLPVASGAAGTVVAAMSLMVVADPSGAVREAARVLGSRGHVGVLLPAEGPLTGRDRVRYATLLAALGRRSVPFPHPRLGDELSGLLAASGFEVVSDTSARFRYGLDRPGAAERFVESLYVPNCSDRRRRAALALARGWGGRELGMPFRRVVARRLD